MSIITFHASSLNIPIIRQRLSDLIDIKTQLYAIFKFAEVMKVREDWGNSLDRR